MFKTIEGKSARNQPEQKKPVVQYIILHCGPVGDPTYSSQVFQAEFPDPFVPRIPQYISDHHAEHCRGRTKKGNVGGDTHHRFWSLASERKIEGILHV